MKGIIVRVIALLAIVSTFPTQAGFFSSRFDDFEALVKAGKTEEAAALYAKETVYFSDLKGDKRNVVDDVMAQRDQRYSTQLAEACVSLMFAGAENSQMLRWQQFKNSFELARIATAIVEGLPAPGPLTTDGLRSLKASVESKTQVLQSEAPEALLEYGLFTEPPFFSRYPITVRWVNDPQFVARLEEQFSRASPEQLASFKKAYSDTLIPALGLAPKLAEFYVAGRLRESGARSYLAKRLMRERLAQEGWKLATDDDRVLLAAWPAAKGKVSQYQVEPPKAVNHQWLNEQQTPESFIASGVPRDYALVVFVRPQAIRVERSESNIRQVNSQYQSGTRWRDNPEYAQALAEFRSAENQDARVEQMVNSAGNSQDLVSAMILATSRAAAASRLSSASRALQNTPQRIEETVMTPYAYAAKTVAVKQMVKIPYAIYDNSTGKVFTGSADRVWEETIAVADGVRAEDPTQANIMRSAKPSQYVEDWINAPAKDKYDSVWRAIFSDYQKQSLGI